MPREKRIRDAIIRNGYQTRQKRLDAVIKCPPKNNCFNCGNAEHEVYPEGIDCLLYGWFFLKPVAEKSTCERWESEEQ